MFRSDVGHTQPPTPWVLGINGTRLKADHSPHITSRLGSSGAIPLLINYAFMTFIWTTVIKCIGRRSSFNYTVNRYDYIIVISPTALGRPWPPQANVSSDLYPGQPRANSYKSASLRIPLRLYNVSKYYIGGIKMTGCQESNKRETCTIALYYKCHMAWPRSELGHPHWGHRLTIARLCGKEYTYVCMLVYIYICIYICVCVCVCVKLKYATFRVLY
jgi:hypothetical protein